MSHRVVKRTHHTEPFQREKLHTSVHRVCLSVHDFVGAADTTANRVCDHIDDWLHDKIEITSSDIRRVTAQALTAYNPHAAALYKTHMDIN